MSGFQDRDHFLLDRLEVLGCERLRYVELVVEAVLDWGANAQLGGGEQLLDRLGRNVRARVPQDGEPLVAVDGHGLDVVHVCHLGSEVADLPIYSGRHDTSIRSEDVECGLGHRGLPRYASLRVGKCLNGASC